MSHYTTDKNYTDSYSQSIYCELGDNSARQEAREENNNPEAFVPGRVVRHSPSKRRSIESSFVIKTKKSNKGKNSNEYSCKLGKSTSRGLTYFG